MKPALLALIVGAVFVVGVGVGVGINTPAGPAPQSAQVDGPAAGPTGSRPRAEAPPSRPEDSAADAGPSGPPGAGPGATGPGSEAPRGPSAAEPYRGEGAAPPPPPPPLTAEAAAEADRIKRETERRGGRGGGRVTTLIQPKDPEEREKREVERMQSWERRLEYENDIRVRGMKESVGLSAAQEQALRQILAQELATRMEIVDAHRKKEISDSTFDEKVRANRDEAKAKLAALLSPEQLAKYGELKPREQVLRDDVK